MRPSFIHSPVNGLFEDPLVYVNFIYEKRALLFDLGEFQGLTNRQINRITHVFVTHMHIDHFIGFDRFLRIRLSSDLPFTLVGPPGITQAVEGRLKGYSWNLIEEYPCSFYVLETDSKNAHLSMFSSRESFRKIELSEWKIKDGMVVEEADFSIRATVLEHGIPCLAYRLEEPCHINIMKNKLLELGLRPGPWLRELKALIRDGKLDEKIDTGSERLRVTDLMGIVKITKGQSLCYVVDASPTKENVEKIVDLAKGVQSLYIEVFFHSEEEDRAFERNHLTAAIAGEIARKAKVKEVYPLHLSVRYKDSPEKILVELKESSGFRTPGY